MTKVELQTASQDESDPEDNMADIVDIKMGEYTNGIRDGTGQGLVQLVIPATTNFKLKG